MSFSHATIEKNVGWLIVLIVLVISVGGASVDTGLAWVITTVIGGSILTEVLVQMTTARTPSSSTEPVRSKDAEERGPIYVDELDEPERKA